MVQRASSNGHAICKDLGSSPTYDQWSFPPVKGFFHSKKSNPNTKIWAMCLNNLSQKLSWAYVKHPTTKNYQICSNYEFVLNIKCKYSGLNRDDNHLSELTGFLKLTQPEISGLHFTSSLKMCLPQTVYWCQLGCLGHKYCQRKPNFQDSKFLLYSPNGDLD